jgi:hypothetical protein
LNQVTQKKQLALGFSTPTNFKVQFLNSIIKDKVTQHREVGMVRSISEQFNKRFNFVFGSLWPGGNFSQPIKR